MSKKKLFGWEQNDWNNEISSFEFYAKDGDIFYARDIS